MDPNFILSDKEKRELLERPITEEYTAFTESQLSLRKKIAARFSVSMLDSLEMPDEIRTLYKTVEMFKFYTVDDIPKRMYGLATDSQGVIIAMTAGYDPLNQTPYKTNDTIGKLKEVYNWTNEQLEIFSYSKVGGIFADPMGFVLLFNK